MKNIKIKFENETKTRINIMGINNFKKTSLLKILVKQGVLDASDSICDNSFPTEILCSSIKSNIVSVYLCIRKKEEILKELKENILKSVYEASLIFENENISENIKDNELIKFKKEFIDILNQSSELSLKKFYEVDNIERIFESIKFNELLNEVKKINCINDNEIAEDKDDFIWKKYFNEFQIKFPKYYCKWMKMISKYYSGNEEGNEYINENQNFTNKYCNEQLDSLCEILYGIRSSCALMVERAYIEAPSSMEQFSGNVFIYYQNDTQYKSIAQIIENRIGEDYKELFMILANCNEDALYFSKFKENINKITLNKRIFCILNEFDFYRKQLLRDENKINFLSSEGNLVDTIKTNISKKIGISKDRIIITEQFNDIDKNTLRTLKTNNDFLQLLKLIKHESENLGKSIKIKPLNKEKIISISLNQERMSVQALMTMLYERYNGYLVDLWNRIIEGEESLEDPKKYYYSTIRTIIRNRKDYYREYKPVSYKSSNQDYNNRIDFSLRSGDYNDSKKILKMLVNYGYHTVGFNSNENKILVTVNGEISQEHKANLIKSIEGRLNESAINYFENAFLMNISITKFNDNDLYKALESEKSITIDDFYSAFKEIFKKMSENILRYEVCLQ
ncbi:hypothetical protein psyc5s11_28230 [Clostridium gelidum]|uniref:Uncharacterized protein n=1 Tax=Clostridium gelidum TaxID=704125 RepID=A0ABN6J1A4_9CLOT|nr:hypothetical protein [Clostridium gelidum]BCZ46756.1 hypothetical protein psyc5s11_28230 [Clostridium gelidum]